MSMEIKICIPSKNRPGSKTYKIFQDLGYEVFMFLEPQDFDKYQVDCKKINIGQDNQGISFVRNFILDYSKKNKFDWVCMCDDDISSFGKAIQTEKGLRNKRDNKYIKEVFEKTLNFKNTAFGINYDQYSWCSDNIKTVNATTIEVCIWFRPSEIKAKYDSNVNLKEDRDFIIQNKKNGLNIVKLNRYYHSSPDIGKKQGGLYDEYKAKTDEESAKKMFLKWGKDIITLKRNNQNNIDIKINWDNLCKN